MRFPLHPEKGHQGPMDGMCQGTWLVFGAGGGDPGVASCSFRDGLSLRPTLNRSSPGGGRGPGGREGTEGVRWGRRTSPARARVNGGPPPRDGQG